MAILGTSRMARQRLWWRLHAERRKSSHGDSRGVDAIKTRWAMEPTCAASRCAEIEGPYDVVVVVTEAPVSTCRARWWKWRVHFMSDIGMYINQTVCGAGDDSSQGLTLKGGRGASAQSLKRRWRLFRPSEKAKGVCRGGPRI